ncbi:MAG: ammonium transporter [Phycisphaera sp.]|nr:ammonium transporter [Phycisphaera sp.]
MASLSRFRFLKWITPALVALILTLPHPALADDTPQPDPTGSNAGTIANTSIAPVEEPAPLSEADAKDPALLKEHEDAVKAYQDYTASAEKEPLALQLANDVGHNKIAINIVWTLITGFLVMFMQAGFAMVEGGLTRAKNISHTMAMNFMIYPLGMLGFYVCGFAFMFGGFGGIGTFGGPALLDSSITVHLFGHDLGLIGWKGFFLGPSVYDVGIFTLFLFQMVFMDTTATIPTGTMAERWKFSSFMLYGACVGTIMYPVYGMWVWGGGWLATLGSNFGLGHGHVDFAGSSVVHLTGGVIAAVGGWIVGPRIGKYNKDGSVNVIPAHNIAMAVIGTFILAFGWFGFNPGSTLAGGDLRIAVVATNTMLASATGALFAVLWVWLVRGGKPDTSMMCNGMLAGLVAITAPCAFVTSISACIIGIVAGILVVESVFFIDRVVKIDDPVGAISVHGVNGAWGVIALGLFADGAYGDGWNGVAGPVKGLFYGDGGQLVAECIGVIANVVYIGVISFIVFKVIDALVGLRVKPEVEIEGLDYYEMGAEGYVGYVRERVEADA